MITPLNLPKAHLKLRKTSENTFVWSILRKKELVLTPEEWVRQHVIHLLINNCAVPEGLIAAEYQLTYNGRSKRADLVVYGRDQQPKLIIECKAPEVKLSEATLRQVAQYNHELKVELLMLTNGLQHIYCRVNQQTGEVEYYKELAELITMLQV